MKDIGIPREELIPESELSPHLRTTISPENLEDIVPPSLRPAGMFEKTTAYLRSVEVSRRQKIIGGIILGAVSLGIAWYLRGEEDFRGGHNID